MTTPLPGNAERLRQLVVTRTLGLRRNESPESVDPDEAARTGPGAGDVTERVAAALDTVPDGTGGDPQAHRRAREALLDAVARTTRKLDDRPDAPLTVGDLSTLEAVVRTDGSRPTLPVRDDVAADHPLAGEWRQTLSDTREALRLPIRSVGRVQPLHATASFFFGTAWVVDAGAGLVLTNLHVLDAMWSRLAHLMELRDGRFRILDGAYVDFAAEAGRDRTNRFRVVEGVPSGVDGQGYARLDAAVLRLEPTDASEPALPAAVPVLADIDAALGNTGSVCAVGFPARPEFTSGTHDGVDWHWVNRTLFGDLYGVKRLAPGVVHQPAGSRDGDERGWVFGHDLTTLGGSSGSPVLNWLSDAPGGVGLHFAGRSADSNVAHAIARCAHELDAIGVPVREPGP